MEQKQQPLKRGTRVTLKVRTIGGFKGACVVAEDQTDLDLLLLVKPGEDPEDRHNHIHACRHEVSVCRQQAVK